MYKFFVKSIANAITSFLVHSETAMETAIDRLEADESVSVYSIFHVEHKAFQSRSMYLLSTENTAEKWRYPLPENMIITDISVWDEDEYHNEMGDSLTHDVKHVKVFPAWIPEGFDIESLVDLWIGEKTIKDYPFPILEV